MKAPELTLLNPHADDFIVTPVSFHLVGRRGLRKYNYLIDEPIRRGHRPAILVDGTLSSLIEQSIFVRLPKWLRLLILRVEISFWQRINELAGKIDVHWSLETIRDRRIIYAFSYKNCVGAFELRRATMAAFDRAIINLSHYFIRTGEKANNIAQLPNAHIHADSDHCRNPYFQKFFPQRSVDIVLPFAVARRFIAKRTLLERSPTCAATGSFHNLRNEEPTSYYSDFIDFFGAYTYHPVRKLIYENRAKLSDWLDCRVSPFREAGPSPLFERLRKILRLDALQAKYFSFDIVAFYNEHVFALVGEELSGAPAVGFFEAMACGCVLLGQPEYYDGLGLKPGRHYLPHNGSLDSIRAALTEAADDPARTTAISAAGLEYVQLNCTPEAVWDALQQAIFKLAQPSVF